MREKLRIVRFGNYPFLSTDDDFTPVEWLVLREDGGKRLLLTRYAIEALPEKEIGPGEQAADAATRWMNARLPERIFGKRELQALLPRRDKNEKDGPFFLLSAEEAGRYLGEETLPAALTDYAVLHGAYASEEKAEDGQSFGRWLLRDTDRETVLIDETGALTKVNRPVKGLALRPAVWAGSGVEGLRDGPNDPKDKYRHVLLIDHF